MRFMKRNTKHRRIISKTFNSYKNWFVLFSTRQLAFIKSMNLVHAFYKLYCYYCFFFFFRMKWVISMCDIIWRFFTFYLFWFQQTVKKIYKINQLGDFKSERVSHCSINQKRALRSKIRDHSRSISELRMFTIHIDWLWLSKVLIFELIFDNWNKECLDCIALKNMWYF